MTVFCRSSRPRGWHSRAVVSGGNRTSQIARVRLPRARPRGSLLVACCSLPVRLVRASSRPRQASPAASYCPHPFAHGVIRHPVLPADGVIAERTDLAVSAACGGRSTFRRPGCGTPRSRFELTMCQQAGEQKRCRMSRGSNVPSQPGQTRSRGTLRPQCVSSVAAQLAHTILRFPMRLSAESPLM